MTDEYCQVLKDRESFYKWQDLRTSPMPWIGLYTAVASLVCTLAMTADVCHAVWRKRFWFPCKFFTLNAVSLTLLAVAMKLPLDLTTEMGGTLDVLSKFSGNVFMVTVLGNFMTSLGCMNGQTLLMNITAAAIFVITLIVDLCIQIVTQPEGFHFLVHNTLVAICMFVMLLTLSFSALTVPTTKKLLAVKYHQRYKTELLEEGKLTTDKLELIVKKFWIMIETSSPQFVMARSVICTFSAVICLVNALCYLLLFQKRWYWGADYEQAIQVQEGMYRNSDYEWSTPLILVIQTIGIVVGTFSSLMRWFMTVNFKCFEKGLKTTYKYTFKIENYWTEKLVEWEKRPLTLQIGGRKYRKHMENTKNLMLNFLIKVQIVIVIISKVTLLISVALVKPIFLCFSYIKRLKMVTTFRASINRNEKESQIDIELNLGNYVLLLEGETELPEKSLKKILYEVEQFIQMGKKRQPKNVIRLLEKSSGFSGVIDFDHNPNPSLHSEKLPNVWTLPVVTLTSIAIALPIIETHMIDQLISSVIEGLEYAELVEKSLDANENFVNIRIATKAVWDKVEFYREWLGEDLKRMSHGGKEAKEILQKFSDIAEECIKKFNQERKEILVENPIKKQISFYAADSMYRISKTLLMAFDRSNYQTNEELFDQLSIMIADILCACLSNLPHYIHDKCFNNVIEKREESIHHAAMVLAKAEGILKHLENHEVPSIKPDDAIYIDKWRDALNQKTSPTLMSASSNATISTQSN